MRLEPETRARRRRRPAARGRGPGLGTAGNVSLRVDGYAVVTPTGGVLATRGGRIAVVEIDGRWCGPPEPTSEIDLHLGAMLRYAAGAVVHTHAPVATAMSCVVDEVPVVHYRCCCSAARCRWRPTAPSARRSWPRSCLRRSTGGRAA